jgi:hypothetical protein
LPREINHLTIVSRRPAGHRAPPKPDQADGRKHEPTSCCRRFRDHTCPRGGIAPRTRRGARHGRPVGPTGPSRSNSILVAAGDKRGAGTGPTIWRDTQLGSDAVCRSRGQQLADQLGLCSKPTLRSRLGRWQLGFNLPSIRSGATASGPRERSRWPRFDGAVSGEICWTAAGRGASHRSASVRCFGRSKS